MDCTGHSSKADQIFMGTMCPLLSIMMMVIIVTVGEVMEKWEIEQFQFQSPGRVQATLTDSKIKDMQQIEEKLKTDSLITSFKEGTSMRIFIGIQMNNQGCHRTKGTSQIDN